MRHAILIFLVLFASLGIVRAASAEDPQDILVVANNSVPAKTLTLVEVQEIFLKNRIYWQGTTMAMPINAPEGSAIRGEFRKRVLQMTASAEQQFWQTRKIKTGVKEPAHFDNIIKAVFKLGGSIGYIYRSQYKPGVVKILLVLPVQN
jgi:hypothetical protein